MLIPVIVVHDTDHKLGVYFGGVLNLGTPVLSLGTTYHVCVVRKDGIITGYVDGVAGSSPVSRTTSVANAETVIGRSGITFSGDYTNGLISHVLFHKRALSPEEVTLLNREPYAMFQQPISPAMLYYEVPSAGFIGKINGIPIANIAKIYGMSIANIAKVNGVSIS